MRYALSKGGPYDGVKLVEGADTPFPQGAIHPVRNWQAILVVPEEYRIIDGDVVREMSDAEKRIVDENQIEVLKDRCNRHIDSITYQIIGRGFEFGGETFSLSDAAQRNWNALLTLHGANMLPIPFPVTTIDDGTFIIPDVTTFLQFSGLAFQTVNVALVSGRQLKAAVLAATTVDELYAIEDNRLELIEDGYGLSP